MTWPEDAVEPLAMQRIEHFFSRDHEPASLLPPRHAAILYFGQYLARHRASCRHALMPLVDDFRRALLLLISLPPFQFRRRNDDKATQFRHTTSTFISAAFELRLIDIAIAITPATDSLFRAGDASRAQAAVVSFINSSTMPRLECHDAPSTPSYRPRVARAAAVQQPRR